METTTIYLVRHGETAANVTGTIQGQSDVPLNENGMEQARLAGKRLRNKHFDMIFSSDLSRAMVTAREIAGERTIEPMPSLREWDLGEWVGLNWQQIGEKFPEEAQNFRNKSMDSVISGGETRRQFYERAEKVLQHLVSEYSGKELLCVTHGGLLRAMFVTVTGFAPLSEMIRTDNTCLCCFRYLHEKAQWQLVTWNDTAHLEGGALSSGW